MFSDFPHFWRWINALQMAYVLQWGCGDRVTLFLILPSILEHLMSWTGLNASRISMRGKTRFNPYQRVTEAHLSSCMAGMNQANPNLFLSACLKEI